MSEFKPNQSVRITETGQVGMITRVWRVDDPDEEIWVQLYGAPPGEGRVIGLSPGQLEPMTKIKREHWLHGRKAEDGKRYVEFNIHVVHETQCSECIHDDVCDKDFEKRCNNYEFGQSQGSGCATCIHRYTRFASKEKDHIPCFGCAFFKPKGRKPLESEEH